MSWPTTETFVTAFLRSAWALRRCLIHRFGTGNRPFDAPAPAPLPPRSEPSRIPWTSHVCDLRSTTAAHHALWGDRPPSGARRRLRGRRRHRWSHAPALRRCRRSHHQGRHIRLRVAAGISEYSAATRTVRHSGLRRLAPRDAVLPKPRRGAAEQHRPGHASGDHRYRRCAFPRAQRRRCPGCRSRPCAQHNCGGH